MQWICDIYSLLILHWLCNSTGGFVSHWGGGGATGREPDHTVCPVRGPARGKLRVLRGHGCPQVWQRNSIQKLHLAACSWWSSWGKKEGRIMQSAAFYMNVQWFNMNHPSRNTFQRITCIILMQNIFSYFLLFSWQIMVILPCILHMKFIFL